MEPSDIKLLLNYVEGFGLILAFSSARRHCWVAHLEKWARDYDIRNWSSSDLEGSIVEILIQAIIAIPLVVAGVFSIVALIQGVMIVGLVFVFSLIVLMFRLFSDGNFTTTLGVLIAVLGFVGGFL